MTLLKSATLSSTNILIGGGVKLDVSGLTTTPFVLADYQVPGNPSATAVLIGSVDAASVPGAISLAYASGTPALTVSNGSLTLAATTPVKVNNTGSALGNGSYKLISVGAGGTVAGSGMGAGGTAVLSLTGSELYLNVTGAATVNTNTL